MTATSKLFVFSKIKLKHIILNMNPNVVGNSMSAVCIILINCFERVFILSSNRPLKTEWRKSVLCGIR